MNGTSRLQRLPARTIAIVWPILVGAGSAGGNASKDKMLPQRKRRFQ